MGYTHYWQLKEEPEHKNIKTALKDIRKVLEKYKRLIQYESEDERPPVVDQNLIRFNGKDGDGHETFYFRFPAKKQNWQSVDDGYIFNFCKTARKPYDIVVCECLLILKAHLGTDIKLDSDGFSNEVKEFDGVWSLAITEVRALGYVIETKVENRKGTPYFDCKITKCEPGKQNMGD